MVNYIPNENHNLKRNSKLYRGATRPILPTDKFSYFIAGSDKLPSSYFKKKSTVDTPDRKILEFLGILWI